MISPYNVYHVLPTPISVFGLQRFIVNMNSNGFACRKKGSKKIFSFDDLSIQIQWHYCFDYCPNGKVGCIWISVHIVQLAEFANIRRKVYIVFDMVVNVMESYNEISFRDWICFLVVDRWWNLWNRIRWLEKITVTCLLFWRTWINHLLWAYRRTG